MKKLIPYIPIIGILLVLFTDKYEMEEVFGSNRKLYWFNYYFSMIVQGISVILFIELLIWHFKTF